MGSQDTKEIEEDKKEEILPKYRIETKSKPAAIGRREKAQENMTLIRRSPTENRAVATQGNSSWSRNERSVNMIFGKSSEPKKQRSHLSCRP